MIWWHSRRDRSRCPLDQISGTQCRNRHCSMAYPGSSFTKDFDLSVAWLAEYITRSVVANYMRIDWQAVGNCIFRSLYALEPERFKRLNGLVNIGIDETSYRKGHKYITVIVNHDTNAVVWVADGHRKSVLKQFYKALSPEQLASIKVGTGDGVRRIADCVNVDASFSYSFL